MTPPPRSSPRSQRPRAMHLGPRRRRPLVLDAALPVFAERGFQATSMDAVAAAAGVTKPVLYECFASKAALYEALLEREAERLRGQLVDSLPDDLEPDDVEAVLAAGYTAVLQTAVAAPDGWRLVMHASAPPSADPDDELVMDRGRRRQYELIRRLAERSLAARGAREPERLGALLASLIVGIGEAAVRLVLERPGEWAPEELGAVLGRVAAAADDAIAQAPPRPTSARRP